MIYRIPKYKIHLKLLLAIILTFTACSCVTINKGSSYNRLLAINRIYNQKVLMRFALEDKDWKVRNSAFGKLNNESLNVISKMSTDPAVIIASKIRLQQTTWSEEFAKSSVSPNSLGNIIGAAALVNSPQPASTDVISACHKYIRQGDASRIPELINLLNRFGDKTLAEDYMNCGREELKSAGESWGSSHGYRIETGSGSHRVTWGKN